MLIKTQVKRRTQTINNYILQVRQKVYDRRFREAIEILRYSKESINNSYMAPYDPNSYLLDSLKTKHQKLVKQKEVIQMMVREKLQDINKVKIRRGYSIQLSSNSNGYHYDESQFFQKLCAQEVGAYASRLTLRLEHVEKIDYEVVTLQTDYHVLRIILDQTVTNIRYENITSIEAQDLYVLISWRGEKNNHNYMIIKFEHEEQRKIWNRCFTFSRLICECELKDRLFSKPQEYNINIKPQSPNIKELDDQAIIKELFQKPIANSKQINLNIATNRSSAYDRLRRKSQYAPAGLINRSKSRKVSEDLTLKQGFAKNNYFYQRKLVINKSQKSFDDQLSLSNSNKTKIQENKKEGKKSEVHNSKILKMIEEREKLQSDSKLGSNTQSNRQIFFNESSIHWIEQENDQQKSKSSVNSKKIQGGKPILTLDIFHKEGGIEQSQHISEAPAQIEQSPLLPHNLRQKRQNQRSRVGMFQVQIKQVPNSPGYQNSLNSSKKATKYKQNNENGVSISKSRRGSGSVKKGIHQFLNQMQQGQEQQNGDSVNDESNYESIPKDKKANKSEIQDKSQDLMSENQVSETESRKYGLDDLKFGIVVLKCSANGWKQHIKKLHLSNNDMQLCWKNLKGDDLKKINILDIQKIQYMVVTPGISKHIKNISNKRCMSIKYRTRDQFKMLQFYLPDDQDVQSLVNFYQKFKSYFMYKKNQDL